MKFHDPRRGYNVVRGGYNRGGYNVGWGRWGYNMFKKIVFFWGSGMFKTRNVSTGHGCPQHIHVTQLTRTIFELNSRIKATHVLSKFHGNWAKNVTSTVFTCFHYIHIEKKSPLTGSHVFSPIPTIFKLVRDINKTNVLTNFHDDWPKIVTSRVFTRENCHYVHIEKNAPPTGGHVFSPIWTIFELVRDINRTNVLTNFHGDWAKIVTSRVFTRKTASPTGGHVFQRIGTTFELNQDIIKTNILTNFELGRDFIGTKLLTKFHEDGTRNVASRVFTSKW
ncbi:hypothetical protein DPMN_104933 [Dreissena polymorpha]|uniref:Uncharacterized protein n=1 Tax=Dreissena polymorpha TaxID=45954 RepID=A0A9D4K362_DREPO|nr:hypothetical protein DPMN_104933 [Dreissena polymorpha]